MSDNEEFKRMSNDLLADLIDRLIEAKLIQSSRPEEVTIYYPEQSFSPVDYQSFRIGGVQYRTIVRPGETVEQAYARGWEFLEGKVREQFTTVWKDWQDRHTQISESITF